MNTNENDSGTLKFSNPVSTEKPIQLDVDGVQCNERGGLCFNLTCALNSKCCDFVSRNEYFRLKNEEYQKAYSDLLKENQELKALCREVLTAREQYQFFVNGYANGSASISEANHASTVEHEAYSKLWDYLKSKAQ